MKIKLAFYKSKWGDGSFVDNLISLWTKVPNWDTPPYSHVEIGLDINNNWWYYSSTTRNRQKGNKKSNGTRFIEEKDLLVNKNRWDVYYVYIPSKIVDVLDRCNEMLGSKYDWWGIAGFITPFGQVNSKKNWYCSEICHYVIYNKWRKRISPRKLFSMIREDFNYGKEEELV